MSSTTAAAQPVTDRLSRILAALRQTRSLWREVARTALPSGDSRLGVLHLVEQHGASRISDLATCAHVGVSTMSRHVTDLTAAGLLGRDTESDDARAHVVRLTPAGVAELERARAMVLSRLAPALDSWSDGELAELERLLARLTDDLDAAADRRQERTS